MIRGLSSGWFLRGVRRREQYAGLQQRYVSGVALMDRDELIERWGRWADVTSPVPASKPGMDLCQCPQGCEHKLVYPVSWREKGGTWELTLRCPECWWEATNCYADAIVQRFDQALNAGTDRLLFDLEELSARIGEDDLIVLRSALAADALLPCDFGELS